MTYMFILKCALKLVPKKYPYLSMLVGSGILYCWLVVVGMAGCDNGDTDIVCY